jgi:hypothetical protein
MRQDLQVGTGLAADTEAELRQTLTDLRQMIRHVTAGLARLKSGRSPCWPTTLTTDRPS